ncbi:hypothetical protein RDE2_15420 [Rhodococcus sp. RDE2]|nr:hypothetical protein RDE2_15420 [Rhodococcus sp. RDE2]
MDPFEFFVGVISTGVRIAVRMLPDHGEVELITGGVSPNWERAHTEEILGSRASAMDPRRWLNSLCGYNFWHCEVHGSTMPRTTYSSPRQTVGRQHSRCN